MEEISFKERVKNVAIEEAESFRINYVEYEYLIYAHDFEKKFYIITATEKNYLHLLGISTSLKPEEFFDKCIHKELDESNFDLIDERGCDIRGTVRRKIKVLKNMSHLMEQKKLYVQENFNKNRVVCTLGTSDLNCTVGFIKTSSNKMGKSFPRTLMKGNELNKAVEAEILLRRKTGNEKFDEILIGSNELIKKYYEEIKDIIAIRLYLNNREKNMNHLNWNKIKEKIKTPACLRGDTYSEKLKRIKLKNRLK